MKNNNYCQECGKEIPFDFSKRADRKYCNDKCKERARYKRRKKIKGKK